MDESHWRTIRTGPNYGIKLGNNNSLNEIRVLAIYLLHLGRQEDSVHSFRNVIAYTQAWCGERRRK